MINYTKPILITGASGSIGSSLVHRFSARGQAVRALVHNLVRANELKNLGNVEVVQGELTKPESLSDCAQGCSLVYHCAAKLGGSDWTKFRLINVEGTKALLKEATKAEVERFVHLSTLGVYEQSEAKDIEEDLPLLDSDKPYFRTKQEAEEAVRAAASAVPFTIARLGDVIGPGQQNWTVTFIQMIKRGILMPPTEAESGILNPVYIDNLIDALVLMGTHPAAERQVFNIVDGTPVRYSDYIRRLAKMAGKRTIAVPGFVMKSAAAVLMEMSLLRGQEALVTPNEVNYLLHKSTISNQKIRSVLGWKPSVDLEEGYQRTEEWLRREGYLN